MFPPCNTLPCVGNSAREKANGSTTVSAYAACFVCVPAVPITERLYVPSTAEEGAVKVICRWQFGVHDCPLGYPSTTPAPANPFTLNATGLPVPVSKVTLATT